MIAFAVRIGSLLFFMFSDFMEPQLAYALEDVRLPSAICLEKIQNKRLFVYLTVHPDGDLILNGRLIDKKELGRELRMYWQALPALIITIVADKDCRMEFIIDVLSECKKAHTNKVFFLTHREKKLKPRFNRPG